MRLIREIRTHVRRSPYQAMAATLTMFLTFLVGGVFFLATMTSVMVLGYFEGKPQLTIYLTPKAGEVEADALKKELEGSEHVTSIRYVSKEEALDIYQQLNKSDPLLLEMVTADILPASLEISADDPQYLSELAKTIKSADGVDEVVYQQDVVDALLSWTRAIRLVGGVLAALLIIDSLLIIGTVIAMKIALKRDEIEILTLVGASPWAIRAPFVLEGGLYGFMGAAIAGSILTGLVVWMQPALLAFLSVIPVFRGVLSSPTSSLFLASAAVFLAGNMLIGFVLGAIGSLIALRRYLK